MIGRSEKSLGSTTGDSTTAESNATKVERGVFVHVVVDNFNQ